VSIRNDRDATTERRVLPIRLPNPRPRGNVDVDASQTLDGAMAPTLRRRNGTSTLRVRRQAPWGDLSALRRTRSERTRAPSLPGAKNGRQDRSTSNVSGSPLIPKRRGARILPPSSGDPKSPVTRLAPTGDGRDVDSTPNAIRLQFGLFVGGHRVPHGWSYWPVIHASWAHWAGSTSGVTDGRQGK